MLGFADDIILYHCNDKIQKNNKLQTYFCTVEKYTTDWKMKIIAVKCEIIFRPHVGKCNLR